MNLVHVHDHSKIKKLVTFYCRIYSEGQISEYLIHARIQKVFSEGVQINSDNVFLVDEERERILMPRLKCAIISVPTKSHFKWRFAGEPMMAQHCMLAW